MILLPSNRHQTIVAEHDPPPIKPGAVMKIPTPSSAVTRPTPTGKQARFVRHFCSMPISTGKQTRSVISGFQTSMMVSGISGFQTSMMVSTAGGDGAVMIPPAMPSSTVILIYSTVKQISIVKQEPVLSAPLIMVSLSTRNF